jgi:hypothetical protein
LHESLVLLKALEFGSETTMDNISIKQDGLKEVRPTAPPNSRNFDFDQWAAQVRQQMLASLQKRG